ncbi:CYFA0S02e02344g1_1 [Cyberlindnera fabianii]|uniref:Carboxypeptidase n=1 Tax=Cyberlindnera fabianii TaxID=36022 RepID=A0A061AMZ9_CYBFA|nr:CYFA0S02e02344g1_1 [Cyberlindnera fabianii]
MRPLLLSLLAATVLTAPVDIPAKQYVVSDLPGLDAVDEALRPIMYAGHIPVHEDTDTNYFFWKFIKQNTDFNRTIFWLNGGPGCSSMDGALMESGPLRVAKSGDLYINNGSWYEAGDVVFVDQPGGTGFSTTKDYDKELTQVADDFITFLQNYYKVFPEDLDKELYISGESYAGQYIPFIASALIKAIDNGDLNVNLKGLLIGNGWIDPNAQSMSYIPYLLDAGIISNQDEFFPKLLKLQEKCQNEINDGSGNDKFSLLDCENILNYILSWTRDKEAPKDQQCINMYDTRLRDSYPSCGMNWPPDLPFVQPWLQRNEVVKALNLDVSKVTKWRECDNNVSKYLKNKNTQPSINLFPDLLERVNIMLFNGDKDIICNNYGVLDMIAKLKWGGSLGFEEDAVEYPWIYDNDTTGTVKHSKNLTFVDVYNSSHMVPFDKSADSRGLFDIFVGNFRVLDNDNGEVFVETPVYSNGKYIWSDDKFITTPDMSANNTTGNNGTSSDDGNKQAGSHKSAAPFILYLLVIGIVGGLLFYFQKDKVPKSTSILKKHAKKPKNQNHKKTVSWTDENSSQPQTHQEGAKFGEFFNNYSNQKKGYRTFGNDNEEYEDIELQNRNDDFDFDIDDEIGESRDEGTSGRAKK